MTLSVVKKGLLVALVCTAFGAVHTVKAAAEGGQGYVAPGGRILDDEGNEAGQQAGNGLWNGVCTYKKSITASACALTGGSAVAYAKFYMFPQASEAVKQAGFQKFLVDQFKLIFTNSSRADKVFGTLVACALLSGGLLVGETSYDLSGWAKNWLAQGKGVDQAPAPAPIVQPAAPAPADADLPVAPIQVPGAPEGSLVERDLEAGHAAVLLPLLGLPGVPVAPAPAPAASEVNSAAPIATNEEPVVAPAPIAQPANEAPVAPPAAAPQPESRERRSSVHSAVAAINDAVADGGLAAPAAPAGPLATTPVQTRVDLGTAGGAGTSAGLPTGLDSPSHRPAIPEGVSVAARLALAAGEPGVDAHDDAAVGAGSAEAAHVAPVTPVAEAPLVDTPVQPRVAPGAGGAGVRRTSVTRGTDGAPETVVSSGRRGSESDAHAAAAAAAVRRNSADTVADTTAAAVTPARPVTLSAAYRFAAGRREARRASATSGRSSAASPAGDGAADDVVVLPAVPAPSAAVAAAQAASDLAAAEAAAAAQAASDLAAVEAAAAHRAAVLEQERARHAAAMAAAVSAVVHDAIVPVAAPAHAPTPVVPVGVLDEPIVRSANEAPAGTLATAPANPSGADVPVAAPAPADVVATSPLRRSSPAVTPGSSGSSPARRNKVIPGHFSGSDIDLGLAEPTVPALAKALAPEATAAPAATSTSPSSASSDGSDSSKSARGGEKKLVPANNLLATRFPRHHGKSGGGAASTPAPAASRSVVPETSGPRTATGPVRVSAAKGTVGGAPASAPASTAGAGKPKAVVGSGKGGSAPVTASSGGAPKRR